MKKYVFDLDNTLVYTNLLNNKAYNYALKRLGYGELSGIERITRSIVFRNYSLSDEEKKKLIEYKQDFFVNNLDMVGINHKLIVYLKTLSKYDCILWTSADEQRVVAIIKWLAIDNCFSWIFYSKKTNAEEDIERICKFFNCNRSDLCLFDNL